MKMLTDASTLPDTAREAEQVVVQLGFTRGRRDLRVVYNDLLMLADWYVRGTPSSHHSAWPPCDSLCTLFARFSMRRDLERQAALEDALRRTSAVAWLDTSGARAMRRRWWRRRRDKARASARRRAWRQGRGSSGVGADARSLVRLGAEGRSKSGILSAAQSSVGIRRDDAGTAGSMSSGRGIQRSHSARGRLGAFHSPGSSSTPPGGKSRAIGIPVRAQKQASESLFDLMFMCSPAM